MLLMLFVLEAKQRRNREEFCRFNLQAILSYDVKVCIELKVLKIRESLI